MFFGFLFIIPFVETLYFSWERGPAVLVPSTASDFKGFFMKPRDKDWRPASGANVTDWYEYGSKLSKSEFTNKFGSIGEELPSLPI